MLVASGLLVVAALAIVLVDWGSLGPFSSRDPGSGSERARQRLAKATGVDPDFGLLALVRLPAGDLGIHSDARVARVAAVVRGDPGVARVVPASLRPGDPLTASDRRAALIVGQLRAGPIAQQLAAARRLRDRLAGDPRVWLGGGRLLRQRQRPRRS